MRATLEMLDGTRLPVDVEPDEGGRMPQLIVYASIGKLFVPIPSAGGFAYEEVTATCVLKDDEAAENPEVANPQSLPGGPPHVAPGSV